MKRLVLGMLLLAACGSASANDLPWKNGAELGPLIADQEPACSGAEVYFSLGDDWRVYAGANGKALFIHFTNDVPDKVYLTQFNLETKDILVKEVLTLEQARERYPKPCDYILGTSSQKSGLTV